MNSLNRCQLIYGNANPKSTDGIPNYSQGIQSILGLISAAGTSEVTPDSFWGGQAVVGNSMGMKALGTSVLASKVNIIPILDNTNINSFYRTDFSGSQLDNYEQLPDNKINIEVGDEIRVSYGFPTEQDTGTVGANQNVIQDFTVVEYELAPPVVVTDTFNFPPPTSTFNIKLSGLITSSRADVRNNPFQINEYKKRLDICLTNEVCMFFADENNTTMDTIATGSCISSIVYSDYVVNLEGENNPTKLSVGIKRSSTYLRLPGTSSNTSGNGWMFGTNNYGIIEKSFYPSGSLSGQDLQSPYSTDGESFPRIVNFDPGFLFDRLLVHPDPSTLAQPIPSGSILSATLRKRVEDDSKVILMLNQPRGSEGIRTPSGDGYLIPDDLTNVQQRNVQKIINKLKSENVFTQDSPDNLGS